MWQFCKTGWLKLGNGQQRWKCSKEVKSDNGGGDIWINHKWSYRKITGNIDTAVIQETPHRQSDQLSEGWTYGYKLRMWLWWKRRGCPKVNDTGKKGILKIILWHWMYKR